MSKIRNVEFLLAYDDRTWDTDTFNVSKALVDKYEKTGDSRVFDKKITELMQEARFRKVIGMYVYHIPPEDDMEDFGY